MSDNLKNHLLHQLPLVQGIMHREGMTADAAVQYIREIADESPHPEYTLEELGMEPDFIFDLLTVTGDL